MKLAKLSHGMQSKLEDWTRHVNCMRVMDASPSCLLHSSTPSIFPSLFRFLSLKLLLLPWGEVRKGFPAGSVGKESTCNVGHLGSIPGLGRSHGGGHGEDTLQYPWLENPQGQRSLRSYSPWDCKEMDTTEQLSLHYCYRKFTFPSYLLKDEWMFSEILHMFAHDN